MSYVGFEAVLSEEDSVVDTHLTFFLRVCFLVQGFCCPARSSCCCFLLSLGCCLVGLRDQYLSSCCLHSPVVLCRLILLLILSFLNLLIFSSVTWFGEWVWLHVLLHVEESQGSIWSPVWPLGVLTCTYESMTSWGSIMVTLLKLPFLQWEGEC